MKRWHLFCGILSILLLSVLWRLAPASDAPLAVPTSQSAIQPTMPKTLIRFGNVILDTSRIIAVKHSVGPGTVLTVYLESRGGVTVVPLEFNGADGDPEAIWKEIIKFVPIAMKQEEGPVAK